MAPDEPPFDENAARTSLQASLDEAEWAWLKKHAERDAIIWVAPGLNLVEVGVRVAGDDTASVKSWLTSGQMRKPSRTEIEQWDNEPTTRFWSLVVQPYVLIQERTDDNGATGGPILH
jgi:hypothetical protein